MGEKIKLRIATVEDAQELLGIYTPFIEKTAVTFEYEIPTVEEFAGRIAQVLEAYPYLVAQIDGEVVGYAYAGKFKPRIGYRWAVETSVYVNESKKKMGIGKKLYQALEEILKLQRILNMNACVAYPNIADEHLTNNSAEFHKRLGFRVVGEFYQSGYKFNRWYNMIWVEKHIGAHVENQPPILLFNEVRDAVEKELGIR